MTASHCDLDPRAKLGFVAVVVVLAVAIPRLASFAALSLLLLAVVALGGGVTMREWLSFLAPFRVIVPIIVVLNAFFYGGGAVLWSIAPFGFPIRLTAGGLQASAVIAARLLVIAGAAAWFAATTDPEEFEAALVRLGVPWKLAFVGSLAIRLVPELHDRFRTVEEAQRSRGLVVAGGPLARARARVPMFIPFLAAVVQHGYELGEALAARDFDRAGPRTSVVRLEQGPPEYLAYLLSLAVLAVFLAAFVV